ncbi:MAG TPA: hypothetical protein VLG47_01305 [Candidatus Saccharimonadales bacterium]|nr:hypothetical protein [Candidatus Saccharimonadales bacterium]
MNTLDLLPQETVSTSPPPPLEETDSSWYATQSDELSKFADQMRAELATFEQSNFEEIGVLNIDPFKYRRTTEHFASVHTFESFNEHPNVIIRKWSKYKNDQDRKEGAEDAILFGMLMHELESEPYLIKNSGFRFLISKDADGFVIQNLITERVTGFEMRKDMAEVPEEATVAVMESLIRYYGNALSKKGATFYRDLSLKQFMYGKLPGDNTESAYLVDFERGAIGDGYDPSGPPRGINEVLQGDIETLRYDVQVMEEIYGHGFTQLSDEIERIYKTIKPIPIVIPGFEGPRMRQSRMRLLVGALGKSARNR